MIALVWRPFSTATHTHFKRSVENTETPGTLPATFDDLHAELVLGVGSEVVDVNTELRRVDHLVPAAGRAAAQLVLDGIQTIIVDSLAPAEARVSPHYGYRGRRKHGSFDADRRHYRRRRLRNWNRSTHSPPCWWRSANVKGNVPPSLITKILGPVLVYKTCFSGSEG